MGQDKGQNIKTTEKPAEAKSLPKPATVLAKDKPVLVTGRPAVVNESHGGNYVVSNLETHWNDH